MSDGRLEISDNGRGVELAMIGEFDISNVDSLKDCLSELILQDRCVAIVDMTQTEFIDSTTIGALVNGHLAGIAFIIRGATGSPRRALDIAGLKEVVTLED